jgi:hypothetical protein
MNGARYLFQKEALISITRKSLQSQNERNISLMTYRDRSKKLLPSRKILLVESYAMSLASAIVSNEINDHGEDFE